MKETIRKKIATAIKTLYPGVEVDFSVEFAPENIDADFASNVAMVLGKKLGKRPMEVGEEIKSDLSLTLPTPGEGMMVEVAAPGFLNFKIDKRFWSAHLGNILKEKDQYGSSDHGRGKKINVEFVSANPTGPLTVGHGRGAVIGLVLSNILKSQGYEVIRDYYYNDGGLQMKKLGESVRLRVLELKGEKIEFDEGLYQGEYIKEIARKFIEKGERGNEWELAAQIIFDDIKATLNKLGVEFDVYFNELSLFDKGRRGNIWEVLAKLKEKGVIKEKDGAIWLVNGDQEKVLVRSTSEPTYRLPDIAYHVHKLKLGYEKVINVLGADHIAQFPDVKFAIKILGWDDSKIEVIINQFVTLAGGPDAAAEAGKKMSTRKATYVTLDELLSEVGAPVTKFFMLMNAPSTHMAFDLDLARDRSEKNPVYKVQYAYARINSIMDKAKQTSASLPNPPHEGEGIGEEELRMIKELVKFPELVAEISETYNVHHLPHYLLGLADKFHGFYEKVRVISEDDKTTAARLGLVRAVQTVLANGLKLMGIEPLEKM